VRSSTFDRFLIFLFRGVFFFLVSPHPLLVFFSHGLFLLPPLLACTHTQVDDACPLAALAALSLDDNQLKKAEWYTGYPQVSLAPSDRALRRAKKAPPPSSSDDDATDYAGPVKTMLKLMNAQEFSAFAAIAHGGGVGATGTAISMIADIVRVEMDWQLYLMRPLSSPPPPTTGRAVVASTRPAASEQQQQQERRRRRQSGSSRSGIPVPVPAAGATMAAADIVPGAPRGRQQRDHHHHHHHHRDLGKRKRSMADVFEAETEAETLVPPLRGRHLPEKKRTKYSPSKCYGSPYYPTTTSPRRSAAAAMEEEKEEEKCGGGLGRAEPPRRPPTPRPRAEPTLVEPAPYCGLWARLGGRNVTSESWFYNDDEDRGRKL